MILPSDRNLIHLIRELGLEPTLRWRPSRTGFFRDGRHYSVSTNSEFLKFPLLGPLQKVRMAWTFLYGSRKRNWRSLEKITAEKWLVKHCGRSTYENFWRPMLLAKLGEHHQCVSAVFIWAYIKRLFSARDPALGKEHLGHVVGGYRTIIEALEKRICCSGAVRLGEEITCIRQGDGDRLKVSAGDRADQFDRVVFTGPAHLVKKVVSRDLIHVEKAGERVRYLGVICMVLLTRRQLTPFYVLNIADCDTPFTGVIGMSPVVPPDETDGCYLTYFPQYLDFEDPMFNEDDAALIDRFLPAANHLFPDLNDRDIVSCHVNRARVVQPLQVLNYSEYLPRVSTRHPGLFVLNTGQIQGNTVHNNEVVAMTEDFLIQNQDAFEERPNTGYAGGRHV